jgi:hypothetical protein
MPFAKICTDLAAFAQKKQRYRIGPPSTIYKTYVVPNLLVFAKYVLHLVGISSEETLLIVLIVVMVIIIIVIVIIIVHGCGDTAVVQCIIGDYKNETIYHCIGNNCNKIHKSKHILKSITHISDANAFGKRPSPSYPWSP